VVRFGGGVLTWYVWQSATSTLFAAVFGVNTDIPVGRFFVR
jgi:hypothetical protein